MAKIKFSNVCFQYNKRERLFSDLSFEISLDNSNGNIFGLMGPSGSGKSTLLKLILNIEKPQEGILSIDSNNRPISYLSQEPVLFDHLSIKDNAQYFRKIRNYRKDFDQNLFDEILSKLDLANILNSQKKISQLSGGQKQRISLLRALSIKPQILLLDEPLSGIDDIVKESFLKTLIEVSSKYGIVVIYVTHHFQEVDFISDHILYLDRPLSNNSASKLFLSRIEEFKEFPTTISAHKAANGNNSIVMPIFTSKNMITSEISLSYSDQYCEKYYFGFNPSDITLKDDGNIEISIVHRNNNFSLIKINKTGFLLNIPSSIINNIKGRNLCIKIPSKGILYNAQGFIESNINLTNKTIN